MDVVEQDVGPREGLSVMNHPVRPSDACCSLRKASVEFWKYADGVAEADAS